MWNSNLLLIESSTKKVSEEEKKELERLHYYDYNALRKAAECHKQVNLLII